MDLTPRNTNAYLLCNIYHINLLKKLAYYGNSKFSFLERLRNIMISGAFIAQVVEWETRGS